MISEFGSVAINDDGDAATGNAVEIELEEGEIASGDGADNRKSPSDNGVPAYDKTKSFFDNISCEAMERSKGRPNRPDWKAEKQLNRETFGATGFNRRNYNQGYRGRGGGNYYGGYRNYNNQQGGQGGGGYYNGGGQGGRGGYGG